MKYLFEKGVDMPICAVRNEFYIDYLTGLIITEESKINFIKEGIKTKRFFTKDVDLNIYIIEEEISKNHDRKFIAFNYCFNGASNYLSYNKQPIKNINILKKNLSIGKYFQTLVWSEI